MKREEDQLPPGQFPGGTVDADFLNMLSAEAIQYIHEDAREEVLNVLTNTDDTPAAIAATTYKITRGLIERHKPAALSLDADMSHATALATEVVDMLVEIVERVEPTAAMDPDKLREEALLRAVVMHGEEAEKNLTDDEKEQAQVRYSKMMQDGTVDQGLQYVNQRSRELGLNSKDWERQGKEAGTGFAQGVVDKEFAQPKVKPVAQAVQQGLRQEPPPSAEQPLLPQDVQAPPEQAIPAPAPQERPAQPLMEGM